MASEPLPFSWRQVDNPITVNGDLFARRVIENDLRVHGPFQGYYYAAYETEEGHDLYRTLSGKRWIWQSRIVYTQTNAAGGAMIADYSVATGQLARVIAGKCRNSGTNTAGWQLTDEDNNETVPLASIASAAATVCHIPNVGKDSATNNNAIFSSGLIIPPGAKLTALQTGAGAQNDTMTVALVLELLNLGTEPTISKARSTNAGDVTQGTDSISDANDLQEMLC